MEERNVVQATLWASMGNEAIQAIQDLRWMIALVIILIITDFRFGMKESKMLHDKAIEIGNKTLAKMTEFHTSRAIRRSCNKLVDWMTLLIVFCVLGIAITEPYGICSHTITAGMAVIIAYICEIVSIFGHFFALRGIELPKFTWSSSFLFFGRLLASFAKTKSEDFGNALDETVQQTFAESKADKEQKKEEPSDIEPIDNDSL